jgi:hypothetical protein
MEWELRKRTDAASKDAPANVNRDAFNITTPWKSSSERLSRILRGFPSPVKLIEVGVVLKPFKSSEKAR